MILIDWVEFTFVAIKDDPYGQIILALAPDVYGRLINTFMSVFGLMWYRTCNFVTSIPSVYYPTNLILCFLHTPRTVRHFHFTGWPDHGVPTFATSLIDFREKVRAFDATAKGPMIVHCRLVAIHQILI